mgnify:FL=1
MSTKINGNQIDAATRAIITALTVTEQINLPALTQTAINGLGTPAYGTLVYNTTEDMAQIYLQDAAAGVPGWDDVGGGGPSVGEDSIIRTNGTTISENITVGPTANGGVEFTNGFTAGPIQIASGNTVTIENGAGWFILGGEENDLKEGEVVQAKFSSTPPNRYLIQSNELAQIPNLEVSIAPTHTNSKIVLIAMITSNARHVTSFGFFRDGNLLTSGLHSGNNDNVSSGSVVTSYHGDDDGGRMKSTPVHYHDTPGTTNAVTYTVGASASWGGSTRDLYINDRDSNDMRSVSTLLALEVRGN